MINMTFIPFHQLHLFLHSAHHHYAVSSCSDRSLTVPWKFIIPSTNIYCSESASQTLKYENSGSETEAWYPTLRMTHNFLFPRLLWISVRRQLKSASEGRGLLFAMLYQLIRRHWNYLGDLETFHWEVPMKREETRTTQIHVLKITVNRNDSRQKVKQS